MFVKICGTTTEEDALLAVALGADAIGFNFSASPRQIQPTTAADIVKRLPPEILTVGIFRDASPSRVVETVHAAGLKAAQLHGRETPDQCVWIRERVPVTIKAFAAGNPALEDTAAYHADIIMLDNANPGSGQVFDWKLAAGVQVRRLLLAGGLTPENVADAIRQVQPWGVDVATGVESRPGHKDPVKMRAFIRAARDATPRAATAAPRAPYDWREEA